VAARSNFAKLISLLAARYGKPEPPHAQGPFELVMWENACYLLTDERRAEVFATLRKQIGLTPHAIWNADQHVLLTLARRGGMQPERRVFRWREIARITLTQFDGELNKVLALPYSEAAKALKQFPNIGDPGAEKILMHCGICPELPLESNGLRVLTRVGFGRQQKSYGATYRSVRDALKMEPRRDSTYFAHAHMLLREHGKTLCKTTAPLCRECPASRARICAFTD
jgi:endonuclease-3